MFILGALAHRRRCSARSTAPPSPTASVVPFIATLAMFTDRARAGAVDQRQDADLAVRPETVRWFGTGEVVGIPSSMIVFLAVTAIGWVLLNRTRVRPLRRRGRRQPRGGADRRRQGPSGSCSACTCSAASAPAIAAILLCGRLASASPVAGQLYELDAIAAVVIGGTEPGRRPRDDRRHGPGRHHLRAHLQPADADEPGGRDPADHQGARSSSPPCCSSGSSN